MDLEKLKKKMGAVSVNVAIYMNYLKKYKQELLNDYNLKRAGAKKRLKEIEKEMKLLTKKKDSLFIEAQKKLKRIKENVE